MAQHSYGGKPKPPPPAARDSFSSSTSNPSLTASKPTNNHGGNSGWFTEMSKPYTPPTPSRKLGGW